mmetsp:Transcript_14492/g.33735  ORF Transcript_14492/g.33735 Transcript_14492/m.33735 type:complete len:158 (+) Transcript_14492:1670-2143(+)
MKFEPYSNLPMIDNGTEKRSLASLSIDLSFETDELNKKQANQIKSNQRTSYERKTPMGEETSGRFFERSRMCVFVVVVVVVRPSPPKGVLRLRIVVRRRMFLFCPDRSGAFFRDLVLFRTGLAGFVNKRRSGMKKKRTSDTGVVVVTRVRGFDLVDG